MSETDLRYVVRSMAALSGIPARLYEAGACTFSEFPVRLPRDPLAPYEQAVLGIRTHVGYYVTPFFQYYGIINSPKGTIVIGPTSQVMGSEQELRQLAFQADVPKEEVQEFIAGMQAIMRLPVETLLEVLCTINHFLNGGEKLTLSELTIRSDEQKTIKEHVEKRRTKRVYEEIPEQRETHNSLAIEEALMDIIRRGDSAALRTWFSQAPAVKGGTIAPNQLRQIKNTFVVSATLASRAAIRGGLSEDDAFVLSDAYIQRAELLSDHSKLYNLQYSMILEFTEQVEKLDLERLGPMFENAPVFPERVNTEFIRVVNETTIKMRCYERGNGETMACGTGACAAVVAAVENGLCRRGADITVQVHGGNLIVNYADGRVTLTGKTALVYQGELEY